MAQSLVVFLFFLSGCASYQHKVASFQKNLKTGNTQKALAKIKPLAEKVSDDQLVYLLDYGLALQVAGDFTESNKVLLQAEKIADIQDYHSISKIGASLLFNEGMVQYKGDDFEKVLINAYLAINFAMLKDYDGARVEARKLNNKLYKYRFEAKRNYEQNPFAFYLAAILWEAEKNYDSAFIDYERAYKLKPDFHYLKEDLLRVSYLARRRKTHNKLKMQFNSVKFDPKQLKKKKNLGELIIIYQQGMGPYKRPRRDNHRFPMLEPRRSRGIFADVFIDGKQIAGTDEIYNLTEVSIKSFNDQYKELIAKRMAALATKAVVAHQVEQKNKGLGKLLWVAMNVSDRADLRQWGSLPATIQIARIQLKPGKYKLALRAKDYSGFSTGEEMPETGLVIRAGKKHFINWRSFL